MFFINDDGFMDLKNNVLNIIEKISQKNNNNLSMDTEEKEISHAFIIEILEKKEFQKNMSTLKNTLSVYTEDFITSCRGNFYVNSSIDNPQYIKATENLTTNFNDFITKLNSVYNNLKIYSENPPKIMFSAFSQDFDALISLSNSILAIFINLSYLRQSKYDAALSLNKQLVAFDKRSEEISKQLKKDEIDTKEYLNQHGLCKSFERRAKNLRCFAWGWLLVIIFLVGISIYYSQKHFSYMPDLKDINSGNIDFLLKTYLLYCPFALLDFWLLWLATKKHLFYSRLSDDYNYKNDLSKAYDAYKNQTLEELAKEKDINKEILNEAYKVRLKLLDNVLAIITKNPVESGLKADTSPYTEIIGKLLDQVKKEK